MGSVFTSARHTVHSLVSTQLSAWGTYWRISYFNVKNRPFYPVWILLGLAERVHTQIHCSLSRRCRDCVLSETSRLCDTWVALNFWAGLLFQASPGCRMWGGGVQMQSTCRDSFTPVAATKAKHFHLFGWKVNVLSVILEVMFLAGPRLDYNRPLSLFVNALANQIGQTRSHTSLERLWQPALSHNSSVHSLRVNVSQFQEEALDSKCECKNTCCSIKWSWCRVGWLWHSLSMGSVSDWHRHVSSQLVVGSAAPHESFWNFLVSGGCSLLFFSSFKWSRIGVWLLSHDNISPPPPPLAVRWSYFSNSPVVLSPFVPLFWLHPRECREIDSNWFSGGQEEAVGIQGKEQEKTETERCELRGVGPRA